LRLIEASVAHRGGSLPGATDPGGEQDLDERASWALPYLRSPQPKQT
jgi:hypothetical protein